MSHIVRRKGDTSGSFCSEKGTTPSLCWAFCFLRWSPSSPVCLPKKGRAWAIGAAIGSVFGVSIRNSEHCGKLIRQPTTCREAYEKRMNWDGPYPMRQRSTLKAKTRKKIKEMVISTTVIERSLKKALQNVKIYITTGNGKNVPVRLLRQANSYTVVGKWLLQRTTDGLRVLPPVNKIRMIVNAFHDAVRYWGATATLERLKSRFWWPIIVRELSDYVKSFHEYQLCENRSNIFCGNKQPVEGLFSSFSMHFAGLLPQTHHRNQYLLLSVDYLSTWMILKPTKSQTLTGAMKFFEGEIIRQFGSPRAIFTDGDPAVISAAWLWALKSKGIAVKIVAPCSPQENGRAERIVKTVKAALTKVVLIKECNWVKKIKKIERYYRTRSVFDGFFPYNARRAAGEAKTTVAYFLWRWLFNSISQQKCRKKIADERKSCEVDGYERPSKQKDTYRGPFLVGTVFRLVTL